MLILSRRTNESVRVGADVIITVVGFSGNQIRLGITAAPDVAIDREEVRQRKASERSGSLRAVTAPAAQPAEASTAQQSTAGRRRLRLQAE